MAPLGGELECARAWRLRTISLEAKGRRYDGAIYRAAGLGGDVGVWGADGGVDRVGGVVSDA